MLGHSRFRSQAVVQGLRALLGIASACFLDTTARAEASIVSEAVELHSGPSEPLLLKVRLRVAAASQHDGKSSPPPTSVLPLTNWKRDGEDWVSEPGSKITGLQVKVRLRSQADGHSELLVETKATAPTWLRLLSLELESDSVGAEVADATCGPKK